ncbi:transposase [Streptomyces sp. CWNU-52B]|uniref:transposase n=1 Tax=unclassified Streptomyces TaxID=2593676 RepID=UPI0039BFAD5B
MTSESSSSTRGCDCLAHRFGNAADRPDRRPRYGSDTSDSEWVLVRDLLPVPGWLSGRGGRPEGYCHRLMIDEVRYLVDNGIKWRAMPSAPARTAARNPVPGSWTRSR